MNPKVILSIQDLSVSFPGKEKEITVVSNLHLTLHQGNWLAIVGESGSGKSITAKAIMGLLPETATAKGKILFKEELDLLNPAVIQKHRGQSLAMIFQEPMSSLNPVMKISDQLAEALSNNLSKEEKFQICKSWMEKVRIADPIVSLNKFPHQLSGGQRQRVMIAMALMSQPDILIADEPTTALDTLTQKEILDLMKGLQKELGTSILFITHDLDLVKHSASEIIVMEKGKVVETGKVEEIFNKPREPYTQALLAASSLKPNQENLTFSNEILRIENIHQGYQQTQWWQWKARQNEVLKGITFQVFKGETLGIVGGSGSGKTTLGKTLLQLLETTSGKLYFHGKVLEEDTAKKIRKGIQVVFQDPFTSLNPRQRIKKCLGEVISLYHPEYSDEKIKSRSISLLEMVGLEAEHLERLPKQFSGGQRQRICIARALAAEPEVLILDEAVSSLDVTVQKKILELLVRLKKELSLTYLFISHDLHVVQYLADRIMVLNEGSIDTIGTVQEIMNNPPTDYSRKLLAAIPSNWQED